MAQCRRCGKRANRRIGCAYCGRGPLCLKCVCPCRTPEEKRAIIADVLRQLDAAPGAPSEKAGENT